MKREFGDEYNIVPQTYILPDDYKRLVADKEDDHKALWIMKPASSSCGRGIRIIARNAHIPKKQ
jgi:hypothetical protein